MIHRIYSTLPTFKNMTFQSGLNLVIADKSPDADDRKTRNSSGKSSLIEIIHFLLGSNCEKNSIFKSATLLNSKFLMDFDLGEFRLNVSRSGDTSKRFIVDGEVKSWPFSPNKDKKSGEIYFGQKNWNAVLGSSFFVLQTDEDPFGPTFRSLISYFIRREGEGGFIAASTYFQRQKLWNIQVNLSFLLGLDWEISRTLELLRQDESLLQNLKKSSKKGVLGQFVEQPGKLKTRLTIAESDLENLKRELDEFRVLPEYKELENEASNIAIEISVLTNQNAIDQERIKAIEAQLHNESMPPASDVQAMYAEVHIALPELIKKRLSDVEKFHKAIIRNRQSHLQGEIQSASKRIHDRDKKMQEMDGRRREILELLDAHGAIDQMILLQAEYSRKLSTVEELKKRLETANQVASKETELTIERAQIRQHLSNDLVDHAEIIDEAIVTFEEFSRRISSHEGSLTIEPTKNGPEFSIVVEGGKSKGIKNMQIFCFDMMLAVLWSKRNSGPRFLVHDSHLFDGMDSRQIANALEIGAEQSEKYGFQYIVTMNSDVLESAAAEFSDSFSFEQYINPVRLSDSEETGGLFGVRISFDFESGE